MFAAAGHPLEGGLVPAPLACRSHVSVARFRFIPWHAARLSGLHGNTSIGRGTQHPIGISSIATRGSLLVGVGVGGVECAKTSTTSEHFRQRWCLSHQSSKKNQVSPLRAVLPKHSDHQPNRRNTITRSLSFSIRHPMPSSTHSHAD